MSRRFVESNGTEAVLAVIPDCGMCELVGEERPAKYDAAARSGGWWYMCEEHFQKNGVGLGRGVGQRLFTEDIDAGSV